MHLPITDTRILCYCIRVYVTCCLIEDDRDLSHVATVCDYVRERKCITVWANSKRFN